MCIVEMGEQENFTGHVHMTETLTDGGYHQAKIKRSKQQKPEQKDIGCSNHLG